MPPPFHVVVAGAGVAAFEATLALKALAEERVDIELVAPGPEFSYRPTAVAEPFQAGEARRFPLARLAALAGARLTQGLVREIDPDGRTLVTTAGERIEWDALLVALGATPVEAVPGALTFSGPDDIAALSALLAELRMEGATSVAFALPGRVAWPVPIYELALLTGVHLADAYVPDARLHLVTPEPEPLAIFGSAASREIGGLLAERGIDVTTGATPVVFENGILSLVPERSLAVDRVVALPALVGPAIDGLPRDEHGFIPTDEFGQVVGLDRVFAAGDATTFPIKQGGIAAQQADAAAESLAELAGAAVEPTPFRPVLRGLLLTGLSPRYLRADVLQGSSSVDTQPLWWPPAKIVGKHLAPFLADHVGVSPDPPPALAESALSVDVDLDAHLPATSPR